MSTDPRSRIFSSVTPYPRERSIHGLFAEQARRAPQALAVLAPEGEITYGELEERTNFLAAELRQAGVRTGNLVALCAERSIEMVVGTLAILKAGGAYVPLDPGYPRERLAFLLQDTGARVLLAQDRLAAALPLGELKVVHLSGAARRTDPAPADFLAADVPATGLAYVIYTSGSTGQPKGVAVPHRAVVRLVRDTDYVHLGPDSRVAQMANTAFDAATYEIWGALLNGGTVVVLPQAVVLSPRRLAAEIRRNGITSMFLTTALLNQIAREAPGAFEPLHELLFGGEAVDPSVVREVLADRPPQRLLHVYGPTENTTFSTWYPVLEVEESATTVPIGGPIAHSSSVVVDSDFSPVAVGGEGRLYVGGDGLAHGYLGRPELTAERFVPDPFANLPGGRLYDTGDVVRLLPDDGVEFVGRADHQVKIRGFRIELGEIEALLQRHPRVREAVVLALEEPPRGKRLVAYGAAPEGAPDLAELRAWMKTSLPDYMVPSAFVWMDALPLTPNGKIDRQALAQIRPARPEGDFVAPRTALEAKVAAVWCEVLGLEVGATDDFFVLGGHSLLAGRLLSALQRRLGIELPAGAIFDAPSVERLAARIEAGSPGAPGAEPEVDGTPAPLSSAQQRLWFLDRLEPGSAAYNLAFRFRLDGPLDRGALAATFDEIVRRHEALRTTFDVTSEGGDPVQIVHPPERRPLPVIDLGALPAPLREDEAQRLASGEARQPFDLRSGPLLRIRLLRLGAEGHQLLTTFHHTVFDGTSLEPLRRELRTLYEAALDRRPSPLTDLSLQYSGFTRWQQRRLADEELARQLAYWRATLAGAPQLELASDRSRPAVWSHRGSIHRTDLPASLAEELESLGRTQGATLFVVLLAGFLATLQRYTGGDDLTVGTPVAGRSRSEAEAMLGFFVNTLPLRVDVSGEPDFRALMTRAKAAALGAFAHQDVPFERLVAEAGQERDLARNPLFQILFAFLDGWEGGAAMGRGLTLGPAEEVHAGTARFDLSVYLHRKPEGLELWLEYSTELFEAGTVERLAGHFERLLRGALATPERAVADLPLLAEGEQAQLAAWNREPVRHHPAGLLHDLFEAQARRTPDAVALVADDGVLTYEELEARSGALAWRLRELGAGPEVAVAVQLERHAELIVTLLAVLRSGSFYVPIDPRYPEERRAFLIADSGARIVVTASGPTSVEGTPAGAALSLDPTPENLAYLIYTSGSTGRPKAVAIRHRGAVELAHWARELFSADELRGVLACTAVTFDLSVYEIFVTLSWGGAVVLVEDALALLSGPPRLPAGLELTLVNTVPSAMAELLRAEALPDSVRTVNLAGEALTRVLADRVYESSKIERLYNLYGPSEDTTYSTWALIERTAERQPAIGRPVHDSRAYVVDRRGEPLPLGVPGELLLGGEGLARGYLGRPDLTAERFVPDPFANDPGQRMYRTGDLARLRADGELEYLGRLDHQVKIRGYRIELGEVEAALAGLPGVTAATVLAREDVPGDRRLVAYMAGEGLAAPGIQEALRRTLPEPMVPTAFVFLPELPLTPHGKVDRRALAQHAPVAAAARESRLPTGPTEEAVAGLWNELLRVEGVGATEDFFSLGGHSILAARLASLLKAHLAIDVPLAVLFREATVERLAAWIDAERLRGPRSAPGPAPGSGGSRALLSFPQQRLWFFEQLKPGTATYNVPFFLLLSGPLSGEILEAAVDEIVRRHASLRTSFEPGAAGEEPTQVVHPEAKVTLSRIDLAHLPATERESEALRLATAESKIPFALGSGRSGPLLRATLFRFAPDEHRLLVVLHHIVSDGWSMEIFQNELAALYEALSHGRPSPLPDLPLQYPDFALWQRGLLAGSELDPQLAWWRDRLRGLQVVELPTDRLRPAVWTMEGAIETSVLPPSLADRLDRLGRRHGATPFMTQLAAFLALLYRYTAQTDLVVGTPLAGRTRPELQGLIGFFVNTLALRAKLAPTSSFADLLVQIREAMLDGQAYQDLPFERLVAELAPSRESSRSPLLQVMFAYQEEPSPIAAGDLRIAAGEWVHPGTAKFDLSLHAVRTGDGIGLWAEYSAEIFEATTIRRLLDHLGILLEGICRLGDGTSLADLPLLRPEESAQVGREWNDTWTDFPREATLHGLFEERVRLAPQAVALLSEAGELSYAELDAMADRIAGRLRAEGLRADERVGVCAERSPELIAALLGALKAGGAYVPLDPSYPRERLQIMLEDAAIRMLLVQDGLEDVLPDFSIPRLSLQRAIAEPLTKSSVPEAVTAENLAYVIFTSGSTGRPKGVAVPHRAVVRLVRDTNYGRLDETETFLQLGPVAFDASTFEIWGPLVNGGKLAIFSAGPLDLNRLGRELERFKVTTLLMTTGLFHQMVDTHLESLRGVRQLLAGGDFVSPARARRVLDELPGTEMLHVYGPTEVTTFTTCLTVRHDATTGPTVPLGWPIANTRAVLLDPELNPVPVGVVGELHAAGPGLARGYVGRPDLTAERFIPDAGGPEPGERLYATGDLGRWLPDGRIEMLGRRDVQVKVRGFRIELSEIEVVLAAHPDVASCVVVARNDASGNKRLVAYLVPKAGGKDVVAAARTYLESRLPSYMIPSAFVELEALPLDPNGKIDRKALPEPIFSATASFTAPRTPLELDVARIWSEALGATQIGIDDNFWELGGHSLLATLVLSRVEETFGVDVPLQTLFSAPTLAAFASAVADSLLASQEGEEMDEALAALENMSEEEARLLLEQTVRELEGMG